MSEDRIFTHDELVKFVETSSIFEFNSHPRAEQVTNQKIARRRMVKFLSEHLTLAAFIVDADEKFGQLFNGRRLAILASEHFDVYRGKADDPAKYDNAAMGTLFLVGFLDMWPDDYNSSAAVKAFSAWIQENILRAPNDFEVAVGLYA